MVCGIIGQKKQQSTAGGEMLEEVTDAVEAGLIARKSHLRVLPVRHKPTVLLDEKVNDEVEFQFGANLLTLNEAFLLVQGNIRVLKELSPEIRLIIIEAMKKIIPREEKPRWGRRWHDGISPQANLMMELQNPPLDYEPNQDVYQLTFVHEVDDPNAPMLTVSCPGVAAKIGLNK